MSYQVIARKWRPQAFEDVTGQEAITRTLRNALEHDRLHHAYLFSGARGVGKTTTARLLAKALNCHKSDKPTVTPCAFEDEAACASCKEIAEGRSIDVLEIDAASNTGVDSVRESVINNIGISPARDRYKVFIIDEVHMLSGAAFNALLKTLEEPPPRVVFIMATTELHKVPDTILSRCQQFEFRTISTQKIYERLRLIANTEKVDIEDAALREVARAGDGSMRDAQSAFDQVISFSQDKIGVSDVETALGIASGALRAKVLQAVVDERPADAIAVVEDLTMRGYDLRNFCRDLMQYVRDVLVIKMAGADAEIVDAGSDEERAQLARFAGDFSETDLVRFFHSLTETEKNLRESVHPRFQLEIGLVKLCEMRRLAPLQTILERLTALEQNLRQAGGGSSSSSSPTSTPASGGSFPSRGSSISNRGGRSFNEHDTAPTSTHQTTPTQQTTAPRPTPMAVQASAASAITHASPEEDDIPFEGISARPASTAPRVANVADVIATSPPSTLRLVTERASGDITNARTDVDAHAYSEVVSAEAAGDEDTESGSTLDVSNAPSAAQDLLGELRNKLEERRRPFLSVALEHARRANLEGSEVVIEFPPEQKHLRESFTKPEVFKLLREICCELTGREVNPRINIGGAGQSNGAPRVGHSTVHPADAHAVHNNPNVAASVTPATQATAPTTKPATAATPANNNAAASSASAAVVAYSSSYTNSQPPTLLDVERFANASPAPPAKSSPKPESVQPPAITRDATISPEQAELRRMAEENPLVQKCLRTFRGEIVEVFRVTNETTPPSH